MIGAFDIEGLETKVLHQLIDFTGKRVFEVGCADGRMTWRFAPTTASVLAFDPDTASIDAARENTPSGLKPKIEFRVGGLMDVELEEGAYDVGVLSWSI